MKETVMGNGKARSSLDPLQAKSRLTTSAGLVRTVEQFKCWMQQDVRQVLPHEALICVAGHAHAAGFTKDYLIPIDFPVAHLEGIRNRAGGLDTPIFRRWLETREPVFFSEDHPWPGVSTEWLSSFRSNGLQNAAAHAVYDDDRCLGSYFSFHRQPPLPEEVQRHLLMEIAPLLHEVLRRAIDHLEEHQASRTGALAHLSPQELTVARWIADGKTNLDIAQLLKLSESTVKHHLTRIFQKAGVANRAGLASLVASGETRTSRSGGTKVL